MPLRPAEPASGPYLSVPGTCLKAADSSGSQIIRLSFTSYFPPATNSLSVFSYCPLLTVVGDALNAGHLHLIDSLVGWPSQHIGPKWFQRRLSPGKLGLCALEAWKCGAILSLSPPIRSCHLFSALAIVAAQRTNCHYILAVQLPSTEPHRRPHSFFTSLLLSHIHILLLRCSASSMCVLPSMCCLSTRQ